MLVRLGKVAIALAGIIAVAIALTEFYHGNRIEGLLWLILASVWRKP